MRRFIALLLFLMFLVPVSAQEVVHPTYDVEVTIDVSESLRFKYSVVLPAGFADEVRDNFTSGSISEQEVRDFILKRIEAAANMTLSNVTFEVKNLTNRGTDLVYELSCNAETDIRSDGNFTYLLILPPWERGIVRMNAPSRVLSAEPEIKDVNINIVSNSVNYEITEPGVYLLKMTFEKTQPQPGFEAIFAIAGLLAVAYLLRRRK